LSFSKSRSACILFVLVFACAFVQKNLATFDDEYHSSFSVLFWRSGWPLTCLDREYDDFQLSLTYLEQTFARVVRVDWWKLAANVGYFLVITGGILLGWWNSGRESGIKANFELHRLFAVLGFVATYLVLFQASFTVHLYVLVELILVASLAAAWLGYCKWWSKYYSRANKPRPRILPKSISED